MPLHELAVIPADTSGARLRLSLNAPAPEPLASHQLRHPDGGTLMLGVLGASHVIAVEHPGTVSSEQISFSEQISCTAHTDRSTLPTEADAPGYRLKSSTVDHDQATFRALAADLRGHCARDQGWLGGSFPGDDAALTAIRACPDGPGWHWQTWHLYPSDAGGTVVHTESRWHP
ncbi:MULTISPECIES: DUF2617 family protein [unclassified Mycolicibacterium]|uniref:DUF2617 family protein n=1 Tax=unclassified Mycolicibacterium TaxID=2636767 RepID=UPI001F4C218E|nr:DUF2617 family protein [Mycolicibacterium sp. YH-1]UNB50523.1 DUF2617 family protein [Mycolicibacterium sp. YH-1]